MQLHKASAKHKYCQVVANSIQNCINTAASLHLDWCKTTKFQVVKSSDTRNTCSWSGVNWHNGTLPPTSVQRLSSYQQVFLIWKDIVEKCETGQHFHQHVSNQANCILNFQGIKCDFLTKNKHWTKETSHYYYYYYSY